MTKENKIIWKFGLKEFQFRNFSIFLTDEPGIHILLNNESLLFERDDIYELLYQIADLIHQKFLQKLNDDINADYKKHKDINFQLLIPRKDFYKNEKEGEENDGIN